MKYMMARMTKLELSLGQTQQTMMGAFGITNRGFKRAAFHRKMMYALHSVTLIGIIYHVGHSFGWW